MSTPITVRVVEIDGRTLRPMMSTKDAEFLGIGSERNIRNMCANHTIKATQIGRDWLIDRDALLEQCGLA